MTFTKLTSAVVAGMALLISATGRAAADEDMQATPAGLHGSIGMGVAVELMAYQASSETNSPSSDAQSGDAKVMARIMDLMATYGALGQDEQTSGSTISTAA